MRLFEALFLFCIGGGYFSSNQFFILINRFEKRLIINLIVIFTKIFSFILDNFEYFKRLGRPLNYLMMFLGILIIWLVELDEKVDKEMKSLSKVRDLNYRELRTMYLCIVYIYRTSTAEEKFLNLLAFCMVFCGIVFYLYQYYMLIYFMIKFDRYVQYGEKDR